MTDKQEKSLMAIVQDLEAGGMRCFCDLDRWEPERATGHSWVCPIHKKARAIKRGEPRQLRTEAL